MIRYGMEGENVASRHVWPASENAAREIREVAVKNTVCDSVPVECRPKPSVFHSFSDFYQSVLDNTVFGGGELEEKRMT